MSIKQAATFGMRGKHGARRARKGPKCHGTGRYKAGDSPSSIGPRDQASRSDKAKPTAWPRPCALRRQHAAKTKSAAKRSSPRTHRSPHPAFGAGFVGCEVPQDTGPDITGPFCRFRRPSRQQQPPCGTQPTHNQPVTKSNLRQLTQITSHKSLIISEFRATGAPQTGQPKAPPGHS